MTDREGSEQERYGMIADDLTGACDTGVMFARHSCRTVVLLNTALTPNPSPKPSSLRSVGEGRQTSRCTSDINLTSLEGADFLSIGVNNEYTSSNSVRSVSPLPGEERASLGEGSGVRAIPNLLVLSTDSRNDTPEMAAEKTRQACRLLNERGIRLLYKKIDSVLRGNIGAEIEAAMQTAGHTFAIITPAFPAMGRRLMDGRLRRGEEMDFFARRPSAQSLSDTHLPSLLKEQGLERVVHFPLSTIRAGYAELGLEMETLQGGGARYMVADAETDSDLEVIAQAALNCLNRPLLVGSGGLAMQAAAQMFGSSAWATRSSNKENERKSVLFIGSTHPVTTAQTARLTAENRGAFLPLDATAVERMHAVWRDKRLPIFTVQWTGSAEEEAIASLPERLREEQGNLLISGGDTAAYLCRIWGADAIVLESELLTGIPQGRLLGGMLDGLAICTKSGGFGAEDALLRAVEILQPP